MDRHSARFIDAEELAALTGVSKAGAYKIIQQLNEELKQKGYLIVRGRVIYPYFYERFLERMIKMPVYKDKKRGTWYIVTRYKDWTGKLRTTTKRVLKQRWMLKIMRLILLK